jgi:hypothetical protein
MFSRVASRTVDFCCALASATAPGRPCDQAAERDQDQDDRRDEGGIAQNVGVPRLEHLVLRQGRGNDQRLVGNAPVGDDPVNAVGDGDRFEMPRPRARERAEQRRARHMAPDILEDIRLACQERPVAAPKNDAAARADVDLVEQALQLLDVHMRHDDEPGRGRSRRAVPGDAGQPSPAGPVAPRAADVKIEIRLVAVGPIDVEIDAVAGLAGVVQVEQDSAFRRVDELDRLHIRDVLSELGQQRGRGLRARLGLQPPALVQGRMQQRLDGIDLADQQFFQDEREVLDRPGRRIEGSRARLQRDPGGDEHEAERCDGDAGPDQEQERLSVMAPPERGPFPSPAAFTGRLRAAGPRFPLFARRVHRPDDRRQRMTKS